VFAKTVGWDSGKEKHMNTPKIEQLRQELEKVRKASLHATRQNDFIRVASLTVRAAQINREIAQTQDQLIESML
jgi:hypothetical protein